MNIRFFVFFSLLTGVCTASDKDLVPKPAQLSYTLVRQYPHDAQAFTQGLAWDEGRVYEGTGLYGRSSLRSVDLETGLVRRQRNYPRPVFAEGITVFQDRIYQLTWKNRQVFLFDKKDFSEIKSWPYPRQGWGITHDGESLIVSDGSSSLFFLNPKTLEEERRVLVRDDEGEVVRLNELEYVQGTIYANVWQTNWIALIRPEDGVVTGWLDVSDLSALAQNFGRRKMDVLNGIMYDSVGDRLFVTGKLWPLLFEIKVISKQGR